MDFEKLIRNLHSAAFEEGKAERDYTSTARSIRLETATKMAEKGLLAHVAALEAELLRAREALAVSDAQVKGQGFLIDALRSQIATGKSALTPGGHE